MFTYFEMLDFLSQTNAAIALGVSAGFILVLFALRKLIKMERLKFVIEYWMVFSLGGLLLFSKPLIYSVTYASFILMCLIVTAPLLVYTQKLEERKSAKLQQG